MTATRIGRYTVFGFASSCSQSALSAASSVAASQGSTPRATVAASVEDVRVEQGRIGLDVLEQEAREPGELAETADLLLHDRRRLADARLVPVASLLAQVREQRVGVRIGVELAQVEAVHPVELRVVERRRARADALERESLDELVRDMIVVSPSGAQPSSARKFISAGAM